MDAMGMASRRHQYCELAASLYDRTVQGDKRTRFCDVPPQMCPKMLECPVKPMIRRSKSPSLANLVMASTGCPGMTWDVSLRSSAVAEASASGVTR